MADSSTVAQIHNGSSLRMETKVYSKEEKASADLEEGPRRVFNLNFALDSYTFADRTLCLEIDESESGCASKDDTPVRGPSEEGRPAKRICTPDTRKHVIYKEIPVISGVLAAKSPVFMKLFCNGMQESTEKNVRLKVKPHEGEALKELIKFIYTGCVSPNISGKIDLTIQLLLAADKYTVQDLLTFCFENLNGKVQSAGIQDCISIVEELGHLNMGEPLAFLMKSVKSRIVEHFLGGMEHAPGNLDFLSLPMGLLELILDSDLLEVKNEEEVFKAALAWVRNNHSELEMRQSAMLQLAPKIRFCWISCSFLKQKVLGEPEINTEGCKDLILQSLLLRAGVNFTENPMAGSQHTGASIDPPRKGYLPPTVTVQVDLPYTECRNWKPKDLVRYKREEKGQGRREWMGVEQRNEGEVRRGEREPMWKTKRCGKNKGRTRGHNGKEKKQNSFIFPFSLFSCSLLSC